MIPDSAPTFLVARPAVNRAGMALVAFVYTISAVLPMRVLDRLPVVCSFRLATGLPCPGCGMTHTFVAMAHGDLPTAWHYNAFGVPLYIFGILWFAREAAVAAGAKRWPTFSRKTTVALSVAAATLLLAYGAYRIAIPSARPF